MSEKLVDVGLVNIAPDRVRKERKADKIKEMTESIETVGLIQPIVLEFKEDIPWIVAGETRLMIVKDMMARGKRLKFLGREIEPGLIPFVETADLAPDELLEIELRENMDRANLTWQEEAEGRKRLYELRVRQGKTLADVTEEIGQANTTQVARSIEIAKRLDDPDIRSAPSLKEAMKIAAKKDESFFLKALAKKVTQTEGSGLTVIEGDALTHARSCADGSFDLIISDPPYGINADSFGVGMEHVYDDSPAAYRKLMEDIMPELYRVLKERAHMYLFCDIEHFLWLRELAKKTGFSAWRTPMVWHKNRGHIPMSTLGPMRCYELILFCNKGDRLVEFQNRPDVINADIVNDKLHAAQKPVSVYTELLQRSAQIGDTIYDPFCGSGTVFEAVHAAGMKAVGVDLDVTRATLRVQELLSPKQMEIDLL